MTDTPTDLSSRFGQEPPPGHHANVTPRDAATLILLDRSGSEPKVLLGKRHHGHVFLPGKFVFPGGRVEPTDRLVKAAAPLESATEERLMRQVRRPSKARAQAMAMAAVRETFEETGLLLGQRNRGTLKVPQGPWSAFAEAGVHPDLSTIRFIARAVTPPRRPRRYDTRFFTADASAIVHEVGGMVGPDSELVELVWVRLSEARKLDILTITEMVLEDLQKQIEDGFRPDAPVPYYRLVKGRRLRETL